MRIMRTIMRFFKLFFIWTNRKSWFHKLKSSDIAYISGIDIRHSMAHTYVHDENSGSDMHVHSQGRQPLHFHLVPKEF